MGKVRLSQTQRDALFYLANPYSARPESRRAYAKATARDERKACGLRSTLWALVRRDLAEMVPREGFRITETGRRLVEAWIEAGE